MNGCSPAALEVMDVDRGFIEHVDRISGAAQALAHHDAARASIAELIKAAECARSIMRANRLGPGVYAHDRLDSAIVLAGGKP